MTNMQFLIDGYNLLHALGMAPTPGGLSLERSRLRFLDWLASEIGTVLEDVCVVFDSKNRSDEGEQTHRGIRIRFSFGQLADDLIEDMIREEAVPARLTVVSNDHRIQVAARRKGCSFWDCAKYVDWLMHREKSDSSKSPAAASDKPEATSADEMAEWLKRFGANDD